jgi:histone H3/H4
MMTHLLPDKMVAHLFLLTMGLSLLFQNQNPCFSLSCHFLTLAEAENWKIQTLPLARIKKIMKSEELILQEMEKDKMREQGQEIGESEKAAVKFMISGEAPLLMSKACELLVKELSARAWQHTERNRRRTLQRQDIHAAVGESEVYDFLIDIVPRVTSASNRSMPGQMDAHAMNMAPGMPNDHLMMAAQIPQITDFSQMHQDMQGNQYGYYQPQQMQSLPEVGDTSMNIQGHADLSAQHQSQQQQSASHSWSDQTV